MSLKLLLLEDDTETRDHVANLLRHAGHHVDAVPNGPDAVAVGQRGDHDVLVLDRMVPGLDGIAVLRALRSHGIAAPALFLSALGEIVDRVEGFEAGGDDYLIKPFAGVELLARVAALARRTTAAATPTRLAVADLELDRLERTVTRSGRRIELQLQEFRLLEFLVRHVGQVVTRMMLLEAIWDLQFDPGTNMIESHMSRLRGKVDRGFDRELIVTVRGVGYRIDADA